MTIAPARTTDDVRSLVEPRVRELLDRLDPHTRLVAGYHLGFWDATGEPSTGGGKCLRGTLTLLSARAAGGPPERAVPGAAAIELAHNFSLLHDDVIDGDAERRHRPAVWTVFGVPDAILTGDALLNLAVEAAATAGAPAGPRAAACLSEAVHRLVAGQVADVSFARRADVTLDECVAMAADKTGALMSCACRLGAVLCDAPPALAQRLAGYGARLGLAFQLVDDLLGVWGEPDVTGKPVLSDLRERKRSVPVVHALTSGTPAGEAFGALYGRPDELSTEELRRAAGLLEQAGSRAWTEQAAQRQLSAALDQLDGAGLPGDVRAELTELAHFVTGRDH